jgi:hypothetical protein
MTEFKKEWNVESAMEIMQHPTVDSKIWAEAVEWLLMYGPPEVKEILTGASSYATDKEFTQLKTQGFAGDGELVYSVEEIARSLGISEEKAAEILAEKQKKHGIQQLFDKNSTKKMQ